MCPPTLTFCPRLLQAHVCNKAKNIQSTSKILAGPMLFTPPKALLRPKTNSSCKIKYKLCASTVCGPQKTFPFPKEEQEDNMETWDQSRGGQTCCHPMSAGSRSFSGFCPAMGPEFCQKIPSALAQGPNIVLLKSPPGREPVAWCRACSLSGQIPTLALNRSVGTLIRLHTCHRMIQEDPEGADGF